MFLFIFFGVLGLDALFWYWADRRARRLPRAGAWRTGVSLFVGLQLLYLGLSIAVPDFRRTSHLWMPAWALGVMYLWHLIVLPAWAVVAGGFALARLGRWAVAVLARGRRPARGGGDDDNPLAVPALSRRQVLLTAAATAAAPAAAAGLTGVAFGRLDDVRVRDLDVPIPNLPPALDGLRIAHVSDTHVGRWTRGPQLKRLAEMTNRLEADLVLFTGDLLDQSIEDLPEALDFVRALDPRQGLAICEGNHDLFGDPYRFRFRTKAAGVPLLVQESRLLSVRGEPVQLMGLVWNRGEERIQQTTAQLAQQREPGAFPILLAHHPHAFDAAAEAGIPLTLAGHTHGGQLMLTDRLGAGPMMFRYWTGLYERAASRLVVSNGAGNWFPLRTNAPAEILNLTLRPA